MGLLENDRRQKNNGSMDHLLTAELLIWDNLKKIIMPSQFKYLSHKRTTYRINKILRLKWAKVAWSCSESFKAQQSHMLWLHLMSDFFHE